MNTSKRHSSLFHCRNMQHSVIPPSHWMLLDSVKAHQSHWTTGGAALQQQQQQTRGLPMTQCYHEMANKQDRSTRLKGQVLHCCRHTDTVVLLFGDSEAITF